MGVRRVTRTGWWLASLVLLAAVITACSEPGTLRLGLANQTGLTIRLTVNGEFIATYPAGARADLSLDNPGVRPPWNVEISADGMNDPILQTTAESATAAGSAAWRSTCGAVTVWYGDWQQSLLPDPSPLKSEDCH